MSVDLRWSSVRCARSRRKEFRNVGRFIVKQIYVCNLDLPRPHCSSGGATCWGGGIEAYVVSKNIGKGEI
jgi:hypothetical protein